MIESVELVGKLKILLMDFTEQEKIEDPVASSYSYECKECTIKRVVKNRIVSNVLNKWSYPDW
jgi:hypothetical protein